MIGIVGYAVSLFLAQFNHTKSYLAYLEEDMPACGNLHHPSPVHLKQIEVVDRIEPIVAWGPKTIKLQHTITEEPANLTLWYTIGR